MNRAAHLRTVEWHEPAFQADQAATLDTVEQNASSFEDDERGSGVHALGTEATLSADGSAEGEATLSAEGDTVVEQVGPYRLIERIGSGAMGHVYRAEHTLLGRVVAIKMLRPELTNDDACVRRFLAEARAVNLIAHEHIIEVTDFACTPGGQPWFVMEILEGADLALAATNEPLTLPRTLEITRQLCEALTSVHTAGIVHRDIKPENVFLAQRDGKDYVTLLDFGIARLPDPTSADPLQEGLMGTPYYMAPEQVSASEIDHRADLYAVGSLLFELIAGVGNTPFRSITLQKQLMDVLMTPAPRLSSRVRVPEIVRDDLDRLVERCLAKQPSDRPSSAREIATELERIAAKLSMPKLASVPRIEQALSDANTLILRGDDAVSTAPIEVVATRRRARRELRIRRVWSSRGATMLSAVAAAAAMWVATSETSWAHALSRVTSWHEQVNAASASVEPAHVVQPAAFDDAYSSAQTAVPTGGVGAPAALFVATTHASAPPTAQLEADEIVDEASVRGSAIDDSTSARAERRARRAARAKAHAERELELPQPGFVITQADQPAPAEELAPEVDRDIVLNPFSE